MLQEKEKIILTFASQKNKRYEATGGMKNS
jgi:hypothetical protein